VLAGIEHIQIEMNPDAVAATWKLNEISEVN
jgi:hypothetical protein